MKLPMTFEHFVRLSAIFSCISCGTKQAVALFSLIFVAWGAFAAEQQTNPRVGEVSLVLGKAYIQSPQQDWRRIEVGSTVRVSDQIVTGNNGHVHIRFVDQALVSVRPTSELQVVRYDYDAMRPDQSTVKFNLVEGSARSISGDAARSARQRFRLNTPIAAIGVRGTDFVVSATTESVRALVNEGTIVMAPYSEQCNVDAFGPCADNAIELSGDSLQILELNAGSTSQAPSTLERNPGLLRRGAQLAEATDSENGAESDGEDRADNSEVYQEGVTSVQVRADAERVAVAGSPKEPEPISDYTPASPVLEASLNAGQLVWGRWSWAEDLGDLERITVSSAVASEGRDITIANDSYGLFRDSSTDRVQPGLGVVGFNLNSAQAFYSSESGIVAMQVKGGTLNIDFDRSRFATSLSLEHEATGLIGLSAMGRIYSGGYFYDRSATQNVVGAVSIDGKEAGYFFDKQLESGGIQGLTLWGSQ